ncbi:MAG: hypothetical protein KC496_03300, partial [Anaerolineae bacterium]|nr:hypothetical protein [Anaerolineae bacterium]
FTTIKLNFRFSVGIGYTAALEAAIISPNQLGIRGQGTLALSAMGHSLQFSASFAFNDGVVTSALNETKHVLDLGLEATDVEPVPGLGDPLTLETEYVAAASVGGGAGGGNITAAPNHTGGRMFGGFPEFGLMLSPEGDAGGGMQAAEVRIPEFTVPGYTIFVLRDGDREDWSHFVLLPSGERRINGGGDVERETGFLPAPPLNVRTSVDFFRDALNRGELPDPLASLQRVIDGETYTLTGYDSIYWFGNGWDIVKQESNYRIVYRVERLGDERFDPFARVRVRVQYLYTNTVERIHGVAIPVIVNSAVDFSDMEWQVRLTIAREIDPANAAAIAHQLQVHWQSRQFGAIWRCELHHPTTSRVFQVQIRSVNAENGSIGGIWVLPYWIEGFGIPRPTFILSLVISSERVRDGLDLNTEQAVYLTSPDGIYADLQTIALSEGKLPEALSNAIADGEEVNAEVVEAQGNPDADWIATVDGKRYLIKKMASEKFLDSISMRLEVQNDFTLLFPDTASPFLQALEQYNPETGKWEDRTAVMRAGGEHPWRVAWDASIYSAAEYYAQDDKTFSIDPTDETAIKAENDRLANTKPKE